MTNLAPIDPASLMVVLSMTSPRWAHKARVVAVVGSFHGGAWLSSRDISRVVGRDERRCNTILNQLVDDRVVLRRLQCGTRPGWCEVNPDIARWRNVPWVHEPHFVEALAALHEQRRATSTAFERLVARAIGARQADLIARLIGARLAPIEPRDNGGQSRAQYARDYVADAEAYRASRGRAIDEGLSRANGTRDNNGAALKEVPTSPEDAHLLVNSGDESGEAEPTNEDVERAKKAVLGRARPDDRGGRWVKGKPLAALRRLLVSHPVGKIEEVLERAPVDLVPGVVEWLVDNIDLEPYQEPDIRPAPPPLPDCGLCDSQRWVMDEDRGGVVRCPACSTSDNGLVTVGEDR